MCQFPRSCAQQAPSVLSWCLAASLLLPCTAPALDSFPPSRPLPSGFLPCFAEHSPQSLVTLVSWKGPILLHHKAACKLHSQRSKHWTNWATKFCLIHLTHLTSRQSTTTSSSISTTFCRKTAFITRRMQKMLFKSLSNPEAWFWCYRNKQIYFSLAKMSWWYWFLFWLIKMCLSLVIWFKIHGMKLQLLLYQPKRANAKPLPSKAILTSKKSQYTMSYIPQVSKQAGQATDVGWRVLHGVLGDFLLGRQKHSACSHHSPYT